MSAIERKKPQWLTKKEENKLGLMPSEEVDRQDAGLSVQEILTTGNTLAAMMDKGLVDEVIVGEVKADLETQLGFALKRGATKRDEKRQGISDEPRRRLIKSLLILGGGSLAFLGAITGLTIMGESESKENRARRDEEERKRKEELEKNSVLGLTPSAVSTAGWRIRYPQKEPNVDFAETRERMPENCYSMRTVSPNSSVSFCDPFPKSTNISIIDYEKLDGAHVPLLRVNVGLFNYEEWLLRDQPIDEIDNRVIVFEGPDRDVKYVAIKRNKSSAPSFEIRLMDKVIKG